MRTFQKAVSLISLLSLFFSCARNPVTGQRELAFVSERQEVEIGKSSFRQMQQAEGGLYTADPELVAYVDKVGNRLAKASARPHLPYEFVIINDATPNAWTLPGGKIAINRGMLLELNSEAELAAVLSHEIVHADARHGAKGMERGLIAQGSVIALGALVKDRSYGDILIGTGAAGAWLVHQKFGRGYEYEADHFGMHYMAKAGYDPTAAVRLQEIFLRLSKDNKSGWVDGLFASHPPTQERLEANRKTAKELHVDKPFVGEEEYKAATARLRADNSAYAAHEKGKKALEKKEYGKAIQYADMALAQQENEALFWQLKADAFLAQNKLIQAEVNFSEAIKRNPSYYGFYLKRAQVKSRSRNPQGAANDLQKSLSLLPTGEAHELLGRILYSSGQKQLGIHHLQIASHADSQAGENARQLLAKLS